ncbi:MAG TPA: FkbM family methyltransferase [Fimbriiglobus sp.]|nr:FkbM family methyltransferase [Fimbriiglobus sp.]
MPMISYAQNREDVLLNRVFPGPEGFYIDVGAAHPVSDSVTKWFYDRGWSGVNVEPLEVFHRELVAHRPRDVNLNAAAGERSGEVTLYEVPACVGWATTDPAAADAVRAAGREVVPRPTRVVTLAEICEQHAGRTIDFLKIDVEGGERGVLAGADFTRHRPRVLVIEATEVGRPCPNHQSWEPLVLAAGYLYATFDGLNRYYVRHEDADLVPVLQTPANVFDDYVPYEQDRAEREVAALRAEVEANVRERMALQDVAREQEGRLVGLYADLDAVQAELTALRQRTVPRPAFDAAVALLDQTRRHLDTLREEVFRPAASR